MTSSKSARASGKIYVPPFDAEQVGPFSDKRLHAVPFYLHVEYIGPYMRGLGIGSSSCQSFGQSPQQEPPSGV